MTTEAVRKGLLIVFEGTDGTGKSTQVHLLSHYLQDRGYPVIATREPTEGPYGKKIRSLYMHRNAYSREEELELFLADRREHVQQLLDPALAQGRIILCDRYFLSTAAYQGARGFDPEEILRRNRFAPDPDLALLFQAPLDTGLRRITSGRGEQLNDFEQKDSLNQVAAIFASIKRPYIQPIDASGSIEEVHEQVLNHVTPLLPAFSAAQV
ncbi:dTMP kinase [Desulfopila sp. IMCC35006]|uniref:dTMP kinase n=1 Tax=Desulfopila sp. IMCC35006 TaxID=2569542 RepID=UPI0010AC09E5|nr:dTMP kinase [Desulfopila sp. IMCC35006]TKB28163.1 dTMP kinase [Desulfopila sp. IMCC35006]